MVDTGAGFDAWNPGLCSQIPKELLGLSTIFRAENVLTSLMSAVELQGLTGLPLSELVVFRAERLALHELLIRVTADVSVPDGSRIGDLGINFRKITGLLLTAYVQPQMDSIVAVYDRSRQRLEAAVAAALNVAVPELRLGATANATATATAPAAAPAARRAGLISRWLTRRKPAVTHRDARGWGPRQIDVLERMAGVSNEPLQELACRTLSRVLSALFQTRGYAWGTRDMIISLATDIASNGYGSLAIGDALRPLLLAAVAREGLRLLPHQERPVVINTKGASASGKSTLRPLQKKLANDIGVDWRDFALISPDIWRKQLLDYSSLGTAYKYAGAFTAVELQLVDQKLDQYMADKHRRGEMSHLLIDRFRFDSFAPDSNEAGSNLLTRFGQTVYLFFVITPPEQLVERAWNRGLEFGRYKAVDDTLDHSVVANTGIADMFFTWASRRDKKLQFEFLDNSVRFGERPRTVAFGDNTTFNVLDVHCLSNIQRYGRINVNAVRANQLYDDPSSLEPDLNMDFLTRCLREFPTLNFVEQGTGRIYLSVEAGVLKWADTAVLETALHAPDTQAGVRATVPDALTHSGDCSVAEARYLIAANLAPTLGQWGTWRPPRTTEDPSL